MSTNTKNKNPPPRFDKWEINMNNPNAEVEQGEKVWREPQKPWREVRLPPLILWYDWNMYHYSDFKLQLNMR